LNRGSTRTGPVKFSAGPWREACEPLRVILIVCESALEAIEGASEPEPALAWCAWEHADASRESEMTVAASSVIVRPFDFCDPS
jgi:hypothetical protein